MLKLATISLVVFSFFVEAGLAAKLAGDGRRETNGRVHNYDGGERGDRGAERDREIERQREIREKCSPPSTPDRLREFGKFIKDCSFGSKAKSYGSDCLIEMIGRRLELNDPALPCRYPASHPASVDSI